MGCDIVSIPRFRKILVRTPAIRRRIFLPEEEKGASMERLAGIFAAKEAVIKAFGIPAGRWHEIEVSYHKNGKPQIKLLGRSASKLKGILGSGASKCRGEVSIAHDGDYAMAFVVFYG